MYYYKKCIRLSPESTIFAKLYVILRPTRSKLQTYVIVPENNEDIDILATEQISNVEKQRHKLEKESIQNSRHVKI